MLIPRTAPKKFKNKKQLSKKVSKINQNYQKTIKNQSKQSKINQNNQKSAQKLKNGGSLVFSWFSGGFILIRYVFQSVPQFPTVFIGFSMIPEKQKKRQNGKER